MTERLGTQDIYKFVMLAPHAEPLTLSPVDLMLLREWLHADIKARAVAEVERDELRAELAAVKPPWDDAPEWAAKLTNPFQIVWDWVTKDGDSGEVAMSVSRHLLSERRPEVE